MSNERTQHSLNLSVTFEPSADSCHRLSHDGCVVGAVQRCAHA